MEFLVPQAAITGSPINPAPTLVRTTVAAVFNRNVSEDDLTMHSEAEAVVILATKLLRDMGYTSEAVQTLFRHFKDTIEDWCERMRTAIASQRSNRLIKRPSSIILTITDNRSAAIMGGTASTRYFDFIDAKEITGLRPVGPLLQVGVSLLRLFELSVDMPQSDWYPLAAKEAIEAERSATRTAD